MLDSAKGQQKVKYKWEVNVFESTLIPSYEKI